MKNSQLIKETMNICIEMKNSQLILSAFYLFTIVL